MLKPNTFALTVALAVLTMVGPFSTDIFLPSLPAMQRAFATDTSSVQLTLSIFMLGFAVGQLVFGPLSDRRGRRPVLIGAILVYLVGALLCALAPSISTMLAGRLLQAIGASGPLVLSRSIVRDLYSGNRAAIELGRMGLITGFVPSLAPLFGGFLETVSGWRASFVTMAVYGVVALVVVTFFIGESIKKRLEEPFSVVAILSDFRIVLKHQGYRVAVAQLTLVFCGIFAFISGSSFILQGTYGLGGMTYGLAFGGSAACVMISNYAGQRMIGRLGAARLSQISTIVMAVGGLGVLAGVLIVPAVLGRHSALEVIVPYMVFALGLGPQFALTMMRAMQPFPDRAGAAASLLGFIQQISAAIVGALVGVALGIWPGPMPLAVVLAAVSVACLVLDWHDRRMTARERAAAGGGRP